MPVSFAFLVLIIRKYPAVDMVPLQLYAGIIAMIIGIGKNSGENINHFGNK